MLALTAQVPRGAVTTYGDLAAVLGRPRAARQVGFALARAGDGCPWHRVVNAAGGISGRGELPRVILQRARLEQEGHVFTGEGRLRDFASRRYPWAPGVVATLDPFGLEPPEPSPGWDLA